MNRNSGKLNSFENKVQKDLGLYLHIPFCVKKCDYCDFLSAPATEEIKKKYVDAMITEIESYTNSTDGHVVPTIFFGGGTPSCIDAISITRIMEAIKKVFLIDQERLEATIEVNPGTITREKLVAYQAAGINRLSFGLQSTNNNELFLLGRIHTYEQFVENYLLAREVGFQNINIDLMSALPLQTVASWETTLNTIVALQPEHISAYSLIIEEGTKFYDRYQETSPSYQDLPEEETDRLIYHRTKEILEANDYYRYEISNYAKKGRECRHNSSYWTGTDYLGIGLGAASLLHTTRFKNIQEIKQYLRLVENYQDKKNSSRVTSADAGNRNYLSEDPIRIRINLERLTRQQRMEEFLFLGLRMCAGISKKDFHVRFEIEIEEIYKEVIDKLTAKDLLQVHGDRIQLTDYGIDVSNVVLSEFLLN
jgi:oxygen-independent coproporphyrinogen-3 oxidase